MIWGESCPLELHLPATKSREVMAKYRETAVALSKNTLYHF